MNVHIENNTLRLYDAPQALLDLVDGWARYPTASAQALGLGSDVGVVDGWDGWIRLLRRRYVDGRAELPTGLYHFVAAAAEQLGVPLQVQDTRVRPELGVPDRGAIELRDYQEAAVTAAARCGRGVIDAPPRCHAVDDKLLMASGLIRRVDKIRVGDVLMGADSQPVRVLERHDGRAVLYRVKPAWGAPFCVTGNHVLVLDVHRRKIRNVWVRETVEVTVEDWLRWDGVRRRKSYLISGPVEFSAQPEPLPIAPYLLGLLLGGGSTCPPVEISALTSAIGRAVEELAAEFGTKYDLDARQGKLCLTYRFGQPFEKNLLAQQLQALRLYNRTREETHIPHCYQLATLDERRALLAGLFDAQSYPHHGHHVIFVANDRLASGIVRLAQGVGIKARKTSLLWQGELCPCVELHGNLAQLPSRVRRSYQLPSREVTRDPFSVVSVGVHPFVGVTVEGGKYLHHDCTVLHNSGKTRTAAELHRRLSLPTLWVAPTDRITTQTTEVLTGFFGRNYAQKLVGAKGWKQAANAHIVVCTAATASRLPQAFFASRQLLLVDEFHHASSKTYKHIFKMCAHIYYRFGMTGTFFRSAGDDLAMHALLSTTICRIAPEQLLAAGYLVPTRVFFLPVLSPRIRTNGQVTFQSGHGKLGIHTHEERNAMIAYAAAFLARKNRRVLVLVGTKEQGRRLEKLTQPLLVREHPQAEFSPCEFVSTDTPRHVISRILESFNDRKEVRVLIGTSLVGEGVDLPPADALVYARGEKAEVSLVQNAYRVCTALEGKTEAVIVDFADRHNAKLLNHSLERLRVYHRNSTFSVTVTSSVKEFIDHINA